MVAEGRFIAWALPTWEQHGCNLYWCGYKWETHLTQNVEPSTSKTCHWLYAMSRTLDLQSGETFCRYRNDMSNAKMHNFRPYD